MTYPLLTFLILIFSFTFSPGPNTIMCMAISQKLGFKKSLYHTAGCIIGYFFLLVILACLNSILYKCIPIITLYLGILGAIYLTYLAWIVYNSSNANSKQKKMMSEDNIFTSSFLFQFINPATIIFGITIINTYAFPYFQDTPRIFLVICTMVIAMASALLTWSAFGSLLHHFILKHQKAFNTVMALLLFYCAFSVSGIFPIIQNLLAS